MTAGVRWRAHLDTTTAGPRTVPVRNGLSGVKTLELSRIPRPSDVLRAGTARARAPVRAYTQRGASPRQAERSPACNRRLLPRGDTRWRAAGGEQPVRNSVTCRT